MSSDGPRQSNLSTDGLVTSIVVVTLPVLSARAQQPERIEFDIVSVTFAFQRP